MIFFSNMKLKSQLTITAALLSVVPVIIAGGIVGWQSLEGSYDAISQESEDKLNAVLYAKKLKLRVI